MSTERLVGYIGDIHGNEGSLLPMDVVVSRGREYLRYAAAGGQPAPLSKADLHYVTTTPADLGRRWTQGQIVWFAGRNLVARSSANAVLNGFSASWTTTPQGHRLRAGTIDELRRWRDSTAAQLSVVLRRYLFDHMEKSMGDARAVFDLYLAIENPNAKRRLLNSALYFYEEHDKESYDFATARAVRSGAYLSAEAFLTEVTALRDWLKDARLASIQSHTASQTSSLPVGQKTLRAQLKYLKAISEFGPGHLVALKAGHHLVPDDFVEFIRRQQLAASDFESSSSTP